VTSDISPYSPFSDYGGMVDPFDLMNNMLTNLAGSTGTQGQASRIAPCNVCETDEAYKVCAEVPGFKKDEITVDVIGRTVKIKGEHKEEETEESKKECAIRMERPRTRSFERSIRLPGEVDADKVKANLSHGILDICVNKAGGTEGGRKKIDIQ
jgi:HSP20 family protein